jgi:hypothetical protein
MRVSAEELHESGKYELVEMLDYRSILGFVVKYIKANEAIMRAFYIFFSITLLLSFIFSALLVANGEMGIFSLFGRAILYMGLSMFPIIPLHELLHGLAFKLMGAGKLVFGANLKEMVFYVTVDRFVLNKKQFYFLALTPFAVFSFVFILFLFAEDLYIRWIASLLLAFHTSCCIGDFALMAYFSKDRGVEIYTYDDVLTKTSYFFRKID